MKRLLASRILFEWWTILHLYANFFFASEKENQNEFKNFSEYNLIDILDQSLVFETKKNFFSFLCEEEMEDDCSLDWLYGNNVTLVAR